MRMIESVTFYYQKYPNSHEFLSDFERIIWYFVSTRRYYVCFLSCIDMLISYAHDPKSKST